MSEAEIMARRTRDLMPAECQNEEAVMAWIAELFRGGSVTGRPVDDWQYLEAVARKRVGDEIFDSQWARLTGNFFMILHPDIRPGNLGMKELRSVVERLVAAVELDRAIRC